MRKTYLKTITLTDNLSVNAVSTTKITDADSNNHSPFNFLLILNEDAVTYNVQLNGDASRYFPVEAGTSVIWGLTEFRNINFKNVGSSSGVGSKVTIIYGVTAKLLDNFSQSSSKSSVQTQGMGADGSAVSGNPILIAGQDGTNAQSLHSNTSGELITNLGSTIQVTQLAVGTTEVQILNQTIGGDLTIKADDDNTDDVFIGLTGLSTATGFRLDAGQAITLRLENPSLLFAIGGAVSQELSILLVKE